MIVLQISELQRLLPTLAAHRPESLQVEAMMRNYLSGRFAWPGVEFVADVYPDSTLVMCRPIKDSKEYGEAARSYAVALFCRDPAVLEACSTAPDFIDWRNRIVFGGVPKGGVSDILEKRCLERGELYGTGVDDYCVQFILNPEIIAERPLPPGYRLGELEERHAEQINSEWKFASPASLNYFRFIIRSKFPTSAVFEESTNSLVAYIVYAGDGSLGSGFVALDHRKKGLFQIACREAAKRVLDMGQEVAWVYVEKDNVASLGAFRRMGAQMVSPEVWKTAWVVYLPKGSKENH